MKGRDGVEWKTWPSNPRYEVSDEGHVRDKTTNEELKISISSPHGARIRLDGKMYYIHRIMAEAYFGYRTKSSRIRHIDGDIWNNHIENLEVVNRLDGTRRKVSRRYRDQIPRCKDCAKRFTCGLRLYHDDDWFCADATLFPSRISHEKS